MLIWWPTLLVANLAQETDMHYDILYTLPGDFYVRHLRLYATSRAEALQGFWLRVKDPKAVVASLHPTPNDLL